jgi:hypothetical protein
VLRLLYPLDPSGQGNKDADQVLIVTLVLLLLAGVLRMLGGASEHSQETLEL